MAPASHCAARTRRSPASPSARSTPYWKSFHFHVGGRRALRRRALPYGALFVVLGIVSHVPNVSRSLAFWGTSCLWLGIVAAVLEIGVQVERVVPAEIRGRTLTGLALLPGRPQTWGDGLVRGSFGVALPALAMSAAGMLLVFVSQGAFGMVAVMSSALAMAFVVPAVALVLYATVYLSLFPSFGAFPTALALTVFLALVCTVGTAGGACIGLLMLPLLAAVGTSVLRARIADRLRLLAGR